MPDPEPQTSVAPQQILERALFEAKRVVVGQDHMIERLFVCWLARGHCLLEGAPGLAKTLAAETVARILGGSFNRLQFTPDLVPADLVGTRIYRPSQEAFDVELGPVFANVVLADEINRAPAKVQSALLEVMAEGHVSIAGVTHPVPAPFLVLATQNPIESEGVYPLPEAQRDRFLLKVLVGHPSAREEAEIVRRMGVRPPRAGRVLDPGILLELQAAADAVFVHDAVVDYAVRLVLATREPAAAGLADLDPLIAHGASPRATLGLVAASRALALLRGRSYALPQDVYDVARDVLRHRVLLSYEALADGVDADAVVERVVRTVGAPRVTPTQDGPLVALAVVTTAVDAGSEESLRRLELLVTRKLDGLLHGDHQGIVPGGGTEAGEGRLYQPGDDVRRIDWNLTARSTVTSVRDTVADRELETWLVVDGSASLDFGTADCSKRDLAQAAAAAFGFLTCRSGNRLGAVVYGPEGTTVLPPRTGRDGVLRLLRRLGRRPPAPEAPASLGDALRRARMLARRRGLVVVISDLLDEDDWPGQLRGLAARHEVVVVQVGDPREAELSPVGLLTVVDPETGERHEVQTASRRLRERFAAAAAEQRATAARAVKAAGAAHLELATDRDWLLEVVRFTAARRRRR